MLAWATFLVGAAVLVVGILTYRQTRQRDVRDTTTSWLVEPTGTETWSMDTSTGPLREMLAIATNRGGVDSGLVRIRAYIDDQQVGISTFGQVAARGSQQFKVPVDPPQLLGGVLRLTLEDSNGVVLAQDRRRL